MADQFKEVRAAIKAQAAEAHAKGVAEGAVIASRLDAVATTLNTLADGLEVAKGRLSKFGEIGVGAQAAVDEAAAILREAVKDVAR